MVVATLDRFEQAVIRPLEDFISLFAGVFHAITSVLGILRGGPYHDHDTHFWQVCGLSTVTLALVSGIIQLYVPVHSKTGIAFAVLFALRYIRFIVNTFSWYLAKPYPHPEKPTLTPKDVTVIIPAAAPRGDEFGNTVKSALESGAAKVLIVTFGEDNMREAAETCAELLHDSADRLTILDNGYGFKRAQMILGVGHTRTQITVFCDDHVFWPKGFLESILAPFEDKNMGGVGMHKQVQRDRSFWNWRPNFQNFFGCIYLERHNAEILATNRLDGGVFIISSRTAAYRTSILKDSKFQEGFVNEYINFPFVGRVGPLNADDDNFIMRWLITHDKKIWIQNGPEALMETTINSEWSKFWSQLFRWVRTTWRSNPRSIIEGKVLRTQIWSFFATNMSLNYNFAAPWDAALIYTLHLAIASASYHRLALFAMIGWILFSKSVKLIPFFKRNPGDIVLFPIYVLGAYVHGGIKLWALFTAHDIAWGSRENVDQVAK